MPPAESTSHPGEKTMRAAHRHMRALRGGTLRTLHRDTSFSMLLLNASRLMIDGS